jgi:hypothetical protein
LWTGHRVHINSRDHDGESVGGFDAASTVTRAEFFDGGLDVGVEGLAFADIDAVDAKPKGDGFGVGSWDWLGGEFLHD